MSKFKNEEVRRIYVNEFFMVMYCFWLLELFYKYTSLELEMWKKREFLEFLKEYYEKHNFYYDEEHIEELFYLDIGKEFYNILEEQSYKYKSNPYLSDLINKTWDLIIQEPA